MAAALWAWAAAAAVVDMGSVGAGSTTIALRTLGSDVDSRRRSSVGPREPGQSPADVRTGDVQLLAATASQNAALKDPDRFQRPFPCSCPEKKQDSCSEATILLERQICGTAFLNSTVYCQSVDHDSALWSRKLFVNCHERAMVNSRLCSKVPPMDRTFRRLGLDRQLQVGPLLEVNKTGHMFLVGGLLKKRLPRKLLILLLFWKVTLTLPILHLSHVEELYFS